MNTAMRERLIEAAETVLRDKDDLKCEIVAEALVDAILAELRTPDAAMLNAGQEASTIEGGYVSITEELRAGIWPAMIDVIRTVAPRS